MHLNRCCHATAAGNYWELLEAKEYSLELDLRSDMFVYDNRTWGVDQRLQVNARCARCAARCFWARLAAPRCLGTCFAVPSWPARAPKQPNPVGPCMRLPALPAIPAYHPLLPPMPPLQAFTAKSAVQFQVSPSAPQPLSCVLLNGVELRIDAVTLGSTMVCGGTSGRNCSQGYVWYGLKRQADGSDEPASTADLNLVAISLGGASMPAGSSQSLALEYEGQLGAWPSTTEGLYQSAPFVSTAKDPQALQKLDDMQVGARAGGCTDDTSNAAARAACEAMRHRCGPHAHWAPVRCPRSRRSCGAQPDPPALRCRRCWL